MDSGFRRNDELVQTFPRGDFQSFFALLRVIRVLRVFVVHLFLLLPICADIKKARLAPGFFVNLAAYAPITRP